MDCSTCKRVSIGSSYSLISDLLGRSGPFDSLRLLDRLPLSNLQISQDYLQRWSGKERLHNCCKSFSLLFLKKKYKQGTSVLFPLFPLLMVIIPFVMIYTKSLSNTYDEHITLFMLCMGAVGELLWPGVKS